MLPKQHAPSPRSRPALSPAFWRRLYQCISFLAALHLAGQLAIWLPAHWARTDPDRDMLIYHDAARRVVTGQPLYQPWPEFTPVQAPSRYFYPPPFIAVFAPLGYLSPVSFSRFWYLLLLAAFWVYAWCLARLACARPAVVTILIAGLALQCCPGTYATMSFGNAEPLLWALFGLALCTPYRGSFLAAEAMIKLHPIWTLALVIRHEGRGALLQAALVFSAGFALSWFVCGPGSYRDWWPAVSPVASQGTFHPDNVSLSYAGLRLAHLLGWEHGGRPLPPLARLYLSLMSIAGPLWLLWRVRHQKPLLQYACVGAGTVLFMPICWSVYLPHLLAPAALWLRARHDAAQPTTERSAEPGREQD